MAEIFQVGRLATSTCIIWSVCYISPTEHLDAIAQTLSELEFHGTVIFDLLLANGNTPNRFVGAFFDGTTFRLDSFTQIESGLGEIRQFSLDFYHQHPELLENSVLTKAARFLIRKNICI
jgi:hypothetical protein